MASSHVRIHDADGGWSSEPMPAGDALKCRVPWFVSHVVVGGADVPSAQSLQTASVVPLTVGESVFRTSPLRDSSSAIDPAIVAEEAAAVDGDVMVRATREDPLSGFISTFRSYELAQISVLLFVLCLCIALRLQARAEVTAALLTVIPLCRTCPELLRLFLPGYFGVPLRKARRHWVLVACLISVWVVYRILASRRDGHGHLDPKTAAAIAAADRLWCFELGGVKDCTAELHEWAGPENCAILAHTDGTCNAYCAQFQRACVRAMDDTGTGACALEESGNDRQPSSSSGCDQSWRIQICACSSSLAVYNETADESPSQDSESVFSVEGSDDFDCNVEYNNWIRAWSQAKKNWCCRTHGKGCEGPHSPTMPAPTYRAQQARGGSCFLEDVMYVPLDMPGYFRTFENTVMECQSRCAQTDGCTRFTWWPSSGHCHLQDFNSRSMLAEPRGAITGPRSCFDEATASSFRDQGGELLGGEFGSAPSRPAADRVRHMPTSTMHLPPLPPSPAPHKDDVFFPPVVEEGSTFVVLASFATLAVVAVVRATRLP
eukprot:TRINITY_DN31341_c0_g1_i1.p1 TRINITY_DN31341_c0_g1~~TRINITY_DN31341_c0_g1_i1.p1  ORF type:complete len:547 (-),score=94.83 TRINITY_DN31341_c0_g1_i1:30-1670(-)